MLKMTIDLHQTCQQQFMDKVQLSTKSDAFFIDPYSAVSNKFFSA